MRKSLPLAVCFVLAAVSGGRAGAIAVPQTSRVELLAATTPTTMFPVGSNLYFSLWCNQCGAVATSELPAITVTSSLGAPVAGTVSLLKLPDDPATTYQGRLVWKPAMPLAAGDYTVAIAQGTLPPQWDGDSSYMISVGGVLPTTPSGSVSWTLSPSTGQTGSGFSCDVACLVPSMGGNCYTTTQNTQFAQLIGAPGTPTALETNQFLYRAVSLDAAGTRKSMGAWQPLEAGFSVNVDAIAKSYCAEIEYVRLSDQAVGTFSKQCIPNSLTGALGTPTPTTYNPHCFATGNDQQTRYLMAWCSENLSACTAPAPPAECGSYASTCAMIGTTGQAGTGAAGSGEAGSGSGGAAGMLGTDPGGAGTSSAPTPSGGSNASSSCSVTRVTAMPTRPLALASLLVLVGLLVRRQKGRVTRASS